MVLGLVQLRHLVALQEEAVRRAEEDGGLAQAVVREGWIDMVGLGRMVLSYPDLPADTLLRGTSRRKQVCRTFSDCTTAPRNGLISGCFPLDSYYKNLDAAAELKRIKHDSVHPNT